ncbi:MAG: hypothetical protein OEY52_12000 [Gammaproteobacteria bacterium]|nr:hypothetical protein [Gammaproteobacteria bacterium]
MKKISILVGFVSAALLTACGGGGGGSEGTTNSAVLTVDTNCSNTANDSPLGPTSGRIRSEDFYNTYGNIGSRETDANGSREYVFIDYMVHSVGEKQKALMVLIPGGNGNARLEESEGQVISASGNFLVRSAYMFALRGFKVITLNRPNDFLNYAHYDDYRRSVNHAVDIVRVINHVNSDNLPVVIAGTSRGAISAVSQHMFADAITISSPVTTGEFGTPLSEDSTFDKLKPSSVTVPAHVMLHVKDACRVSPPQGAYNLVAAFEPDASVNVIDGGFDATDKEDDCKANTYHGFFGIESCAVGKATDWVKGLRLPDSRPVQDLVKTSYELIIVNPGDTTKVEVGQDIEAAKGGELTYSLPYSLTSLGGSVSIEGNIVTYTAPAEINDSQGLFDSFVYTVTEEGGGKRSEVRYIAVSAVK